MIEESRFQVTTWHGEGRTIFYVVDTQCHAGEYPGIVGSYGSRDEAHRRVRELELELSEGRRS